MSEQMNFRGGKYTVIDDNGRLTALRYGEPWRDLCGDNLVAAMLYEAIRLKQQRDELLEASQRLLSRKHPNPDQRLILERDCLDLEEVVAKIKGEHS